MRKNALLGLIFLFLLNSHLTGAVSNQEYVSEVLLRWPLEKSSQNALLAGGLLALTALPFDQALNHRMNDTRLMKPEWTHYGHAYLDNFVVLAILGSGALHQGYQSGDYLTPTRYSISSLFITTGTTLLLKKLSGRTRPSGKSDSFPSGHTSITFCAATVLHLWYGPKASVPAYAAASFTAFSRMQDNYHWLSDVLFGAALGIAVPYGLHQAEKKLSPSSPQAVPLSISWSIAL